MRRIEVPIHGDLNAEPDERFHVLLRNAMNAEIFENIAFGDIISDDLPSVVLADSTVDHSLSLRVDGSGTVVFDNGEVAFEGVTSGDGAFVIEAIDGVQTDLVATILPDSLAPTEGFRFIGSGATSSLTIDASYASAIEHVQIDDRNGSFVIDGVMLRYEDVGLTNSPVNPMLSGLPGGDLTFGDSITLVGQPPSSFEPLLSTTEAWTIYRDEVEMSSSEGNSVSLTVSEVGTYRLTYTALQEGRIPAVGSFEFSVTNSPPIAVDDSYTAIEDTELFESAGSGLLANDSDSTAGPIVVSLVEGRSILADQPFEFASATLDASIPYLSTSINDTNYYGVRFEVTETVAIDQVGGNFQFITGTGPFATIVQLDGPSDFPDSESLTTPDVLATTVVPLAYQQDGDRRGDIDVTLQPGWYAVMFGTGAFGSTGITNLLLNNVPNGNQTFIHSQPTVPRFLTPTAFSGVPNARFVIEGTTSSDAPIKLDSGTIVTVASDGSFTYDPNGRFESLVLGTTATDSFTYTATDSAGLSAEGTATITIEGVNDAPVAAGDHYSLSEDLLATPATSVGILANDTDVDGDRLTLTEIDGQPINFSPPFAFASAAADPTLSASTISINDTNYYGVRFEVTETTRIDRMGANLQSTGGSGPFAALVALDGPSDYPDSLDLSTADLITTTVIAVEPGYVGDAFADVDVTLQPGWYALVLGSGRFNATGTTGLRLGHPPVGSPSVFQASLGLGEFRPALPEALFQGARCLLEGTAANTETTIHLPSGATITARSNGRYVYDPRTAFDYLTTSETATDSFTYQVADEHGATATATVTYTINGSNDAPAFTLNAPSIEVNEGTLAMMSGTLRDPEGNVTLDATMGDVSLDELTGNWNWQYQTSRSMPAQLVTITATDTEGRTDQVTFELTVLHVPQIEVLLDTDSGSVNEQDEFVLTAIYRDSHTDLSHQVEIDWHDSSTVPLTFDLLAMSSISTGDVFADTTGTHDLVIDAVTTLTADAEITLHEINSSGSSTPFNFFDAGDYALFIADDGVHGLELWRYDAAGPQLVKDINPSQRSLYTPEFILHGDYVYFVADDGIHGFALWKTDGTNAGTSLVFDPRTSGSSQMRGLVAFDDRLFFTALDESGSQRLWRSDGTAAGTASVSPIDPNATGLSSIGGLSVVGDTLYLRANQLSNSGMTREELFAVDDASAGVRLVKDVFPGNAGSWPSRITDVDGTTFFQIQNATGGNELWKSDGTESGTVRVSELVPGGVTSGHGLLSMTSLGGLLLFGADDGIHGTELWRSDGTDVGTFMVADLNPAGDGFTDIDTGAPGMAVLGNRVYFQGIGGEGSNNRELWYSDGTAAGTIAIEIRPGSPGSDPRHIIELQDALYFVASDPTHGREVWTSNGTVAGTRLVQNRIPGSSGLNPAELAVWNESLLIRGNDAANDNELYVYTVPEMTGIEVQFTVRHAYDDDRSSTGENQKQINISVTDGFGGTATGFTSLEVLNVAPNASGDQATISENDVATLIPVLENDTDVAGIDDPLTLVSVDDSLALGQISIVAGQIQYWPAGQFESLEVGEVATEVFNYSVSDNDGGVSVAAVTITIVGEADPPQAIDDTFEVSEDLLFSPVASIELLSNDVDPECTELTVTRINGQVFDGIISLPSGATRQPAAEANGFIYDPRVAFDYLIVDQVGSDSFEYTVEDQSGLTATATVTLTINGVDDAATISGDLLVSTGEDTYVVSAMLTIVDPDLGQAAFVPQSNVDGSYGTFSIEENGTWSYDLDNVLTGQLNAGESPVESFTVMSVDGSASETIEITIVGGADADTDGVDDTLEDEIGDGNADGILDSQQNHVASLRNAVTSSTVTLAAPEGSNLVNVLASDPLLLNAQPPADVELPIGLLQFTVETSVGGASTVRLYYDASEPVNAIYKYGPISGGQPEYYRYDAVTFGTDDTGRSFVDLHLVDGGAGDADREANGWIVDPVGLAVIPGAGDDYVSTERNTTLRFDPLFNDSLVSPASLTNVSVPSNGTASVGADGWIEYTPDAGFAGHDTFIYTVSDSSGTTFTATVHVNVIQTNEAPNARLVISAVHEASNLANVEIILTDVIDESFEQVRFSFASDLALLANEYDQASVSNTAILSYDAHTTGWLYARVIDELDDYSTYMLNVFVGGSGHDTLVGTNQDDLLIGLAKNDVLDGLDSKDWIFGGSGHDQITGGKHADTIDAGSGNDRFYVRDNWAEFDVMVGGGGYDKVVNTDAGADVRFDQFLSPNAAWDLEEVDVAGGRILGNSGANTLDFSHVNLKNVAGVFAQDGDDTIVASNQTHDVEYHGEGGNDTLLGGDKHDMLFGGDGNDTILAGGGNDLLFGGRGLNVFDGGSGNDLFVIAKSSGNQIVDFDDAGNDRIQLQIDPPAIGSVLDFFFATDADGDGDTDDLEAELWHDIDIELIDALLSDLDEEDFLVG